ncbi:MAG TPA: glycosyltransferase [Egibacteraceae bacterium]|nr:glycosyltransferase [Egibacteraceae bacterium]
MRATLVSTLLPEQCGIASYSSALAHALHEVDTTVEVSLIAAPGFAAQERDWACVARALEAHDSDVVHFQHEFGIFGMGEQFLELLEGLRARGRPIVVTLHTVHTNLSVDFGCTWPDAGSRPLAARDIERYQRRIVELADFAVVHHAAIAQVILRHGAPAARLRVIPHGTPVLPRQSPAAAKTALGLDPDCRILLAPGYFRRSKNILRLIEAFADVARRVPQAQLWIGGHAREQTPELRRYRRDCEQAAARLGLDGSVRWLPDPIDSASMPTLFQAADVICCAYEEDTWSASGILHMALGAGAPVVASRIPKFSELSGGCDDLLVRPSDPSELADVLIRLLVDDSFRVVSAARLSQLAEQSAWPRVAALHIDAYRRALRPALAHAGV